MIEIEFDPSIEAMRRELAEMEKVLRDKALHSATVAAAKPYKDAMKREAPKDSGILRAAIGHQKLSKTARIRMGIPEDSAAVLVGPNRKVRGRRRARIAQILEAGAKPHVIKPRRKKLLAFDGGLFRRVKHPGFSANPFMQRAHDSVGGDVQQRFYEGLARHLDRVRAK